MNKLRLFFSLFSILVLAACNNNLKEKVIASFENGQPTIVRYYDKNDQCVREVHYYENGALFMEGEMKDDVRNGEWISYFPDGKVQSTGFFENDKRTGKSQVYYENGNLWMDGSYKEGKRVGLWLYYDEQGYVTDSVEFGM